MNSSPGNDWEQQSPVVSFMASPSDSSLSDALGDGQSATGTTLTSQSNGGTEHSIIKDDEGGSSSYSGSSYNNALSDQAIESIRRQQNQNKLIHLDPIPDFKDKNEIKPWLQKIFYPQGIEIVIERSDKIKVVFKCKASKRGKNSGSAGVACSSVVSMASPTEDGALQGHGVASLAHRVVARRKKKRAVSPFNTCPFRVRAAYSLKRKKWSIVVVNNGHSHPLKFNPNSEEYRRFKKKLREDCDWDAIKKFDELEYRSKFNLPTEPTPITCACGMTQEIESFNVILPSNKVLDSTVQVPADKKMPTMASIVNKRKTGKHIQRQKKSPLYHGTVRSKLTKDIQDNYSSSEATELTVKREAQLEHSLDNYLFQDSTEIDFTEVFLKPLPQFKRHSGHNHFGDAQGCSPSAIHVVEKGGRIAQPAPSEEYHGENEQWNSLEKLLGGRLTFDMNEPHTPTTPLLPSQFNVGLPSNICAVSPNNLGLVGAQHSIGPNIDESSRARAISVNKRAGAHLKVGEPTHSSDSICTSGTTAAIDHFNFDFNSLNAIEGLMRGDFDSPMDSMDLDFTHTTNNNNQGSGGTATTNLSPGITRDMQPQVTDEACLWDDQHSFLEQ